MLIKNSKVYDILNKIQRWLPSIGILYLALCQIWNLPYGVKVNETIVAIATFLAATLEISTGEYHKQNVVDLLGEMAYPSDDDITEAAEAAEAAETEIAE